MSANPVRTRIALAYEAQLVDDLPTSSADVLDFICERLNLANIAGVPIDDANMSAMAKSFYADNKRVRNDRAKADLHWQLNFPTFKQGYQDILDKLD